MQFRIFGKENDLRKMRKIGNIRKELKIIKRAENNVNKYGMSKS